MLPTRGAGAFRLSSVLPSRSVRARSASAFLAAGQRNVLRMGRAMIDVHVHLHPPRLFAAIRRWFAERSPWVIEHPTDPQIVAERLRGYGVERFVFCSYAHKPGMAAELNAWL